MRIGMRSTLLCLVLGSVLDASIAGESPDADATRTSKGRGYAFLQAGGFDGGQFRTAEVGTSGFDFGGGYAAFFHEGLAVEFEGIFFGTDYRFPSHSGGSDLSLLTGALMLNLRGLRSFGRLRPSLGVGVGLGVTSLDRAHDSSYWAYEKLDEEFSLLAQTMVGLEFRITRRSHLGIEYRLLTAGSDLEWAGHQIDPGGALLLLTYRLDSR